MLRKIRIAGAVFFMATLTLLFLDYTGTLQPYIRWSARTQLIPAILAGNIFVIVWIIAATMLLGRVYCSAVCPLGVLQDAISRIAGLGKKNRFSYRPPKKPVVILRYGLLAVFVLCVIAGVGISFLEPYGLYGRIVSQIFGPLYKWGNNVLAGIAERSGSYAFYSVDVWLTGAGALAAAVLTLAVVGVFAWKSGRGYCNTLCPVGAVLSLIMLRPRYAQAIDKDKCTGCGLCAKNCKAGCVDPVKKEIDYHRCVSCYKCLDMCPGGALTIAFRNPCGAKEPIRKNEPSAASRRGFISGAFLLAAGLITRSAARGVYEFDGGLAPLKDKKAPGRKTQIIPPGADNARSFGKRCTGCQLCVSACANQVLRPSSKISEFLHPRLSYERGYCRPECVKCSEVCPTGAIRPITAAEKSATQIGYAVWKEELCVVNTDKALCDLCSRKCPAGAITMISRNADDETSPKIPMIDTSRCTGCGACEQLCPARPYSAIYVEGLESHREV
jgi:ferredoxin